ncbi:MAG TPA: hypothetical protein VFN09_11145 [Rhodanobacteraceae bacterium]|nr:hypothetical protein [Rhodanobacteraceae bacterium]
MTALPVAVHGRPRGFVAWQPQAKTVAVVARVRHVLDEYRQHLPLTLRQVFYRLVGKYGYPKTERDYKALGEVLNRARRARLIPFDAIRDDGMTRLDRVGWADMDECRNAIRDTADNYRIDRQRGQERRTVLWCEASGMAPQLARVGEPYSVPVYSSGGFDSVTVKHDMAQTFAAHPVHVLHIGDHDPSGVHVFGSLAADITAFGKSMGADVTFSRLAVLPEHIAAFDLPTAPPKTTDRRAFTGQTVQAEALPPDTLADLVRAAIVANIDPNAYAGALDAEQVERAELLAWMATP